MRSTMRSQLSQWGRSDDLSAPSSCKRQVHVIKREREQSEKCKVDYNPENWKMINKNDDNNTK